MLKTTSGEMSSHLRLQEPHLYQWESIQVSEQDRNGNEQEGRHASNMKMLSRGVFIRLDKTLCGQQNEKTHKIKKDV